MKPKALGIFIIGALTGILGKVIFERSYKAIRTLNLPILSVACSIQIENKTKFPVHAISFTSEGEIPNLKKQIGPNSKIDFQFYPFECEGIESLKSDEKYYVFVTDTLDQNILGGTMLSNDEFRFKHIVVSENNVKILSVSK